MRIAYVAGFRARRFTASRNDGGEVSSRACGQAPRFPLAIHLLDARVIRCRLKGSERRFQYLRKSQAPFVAKFGSHNLGADRASVVRANRHCRCGQVGEIGKSDPVVVVRSRTLLTVDQKILIPSGDTLVMRVCRRRRDITRGYPDEKPEAHASG